MALLGWLILPLSLAVAVPHELAHLLVARAFGIRVLEFGLGLPPRAFSFTGGGITWSVSWLLPMGAFVRLKGEDGGCEPDDFAARPAWQRSAVVIAGPLANVLVAAVATGLLFALGLRPADFSAAQVQLHPATPSFVGWLGLGQVMDEMAILGISPVGWFLALLAALSLGLAVANLLPFPPLDGSRLLLYSLHGLSSGRLVPSGRFLGRLNVAGFVALLLVFAAVTGSDLLRLAAGQSLLRL